MVAALRVLVIEDQEDCAASTAQLLQMLGCDVGVARTGGAGLAAVSDFHPDAVLLDLGLPDITGWDVARAVWKQAGLIRPYLIAVTGYGQDAHRDQSREAGIDLHLIKPVDPEQWKNLLDQIGRRMSAAPAS